MTYRVRLFARARDLAGADTVQVNLPGLATVADLRQRLKAEIPPLAPLLDRCAIAVDGDFAEDNWPLRKGAEIALLPPVSGGQEAN
jgi:molybdopterin converting factor subunit 1